ncbi:MAG TPA: TetR/AcrR family transcriptional regulator [Solirubrobacterales bacterium]|nr:TetR/AcrR family transcriptional regulator [Solirubrobacterales bacterium]
MSPRASASAAAETRSGIIDAAVRQASLEGLESVTIGRLAGSLEMSKAGVIGPFGTKERIQLAALESAIEIFRRKVWSPASEAEPGLSRLEAITEAWLDYLTGEVFPGGCFLTGAAAEFDGRPGEVRDAVDRTLRLWEGVLEHEAEVAVEKGELPAETDPGQIAFEIHAIAQGVNQARQLRDDPRARERGATAFRRILNADGAVSPSSR